MIRIAVVGMGKIAVDQHLPAIHANPRFTFHLKESAQRDLPAHATPITDPATRRAIFVTILERLGRSKDLEEWETGSPLVEVTFE